MLIFVNIILAAILLLEFGASVSMGFCRNNMYQKILEN